LGDAAIQDAVIDNVRTRYPEAIIYMISINPMVTTQLHHVPSFPITPFGVSSYAQGASIAKAHNKTRSVSASDNQGLLNTTKKIIRSLPLLYQFLTLAQKQINRILNAPKQIYQEIIHAAKAYKFLKGIDLLIVSGGGQLDDYWGGPWGHPYALLKWGLIAKARGSNYIFLSVGTCAIESKLSATFIKQALRLADYRSYRDNTSKELLNRISFTRNDFVYPDLAFSYINCAMRERQDTPPEGKVVGISPIAYHSGCGWFKNDIAAYEQYINTIITFISTLVHNEYSVVLFSTEEVDRKRFGDIINGLRKFHKHDIADKIIYAHTDTPEKLFNHLCNVNYVVASRLHGVLLSNLCCLPVLAISYDRKVDTYMADAGFEDYLLKIDNIDINLLLNKFESLSTNSKSIKSRLMTNNRNNFSELKRQYDLVLGGVLDA
jgi:polysaccharide pyruvyl transferase WcaK-like protein